MPAGLILPVFGLLESRLQAFCNPLADLDFDLDADDHLD